MYKHNHLTFATATFTVYGQLLIPQNLRTTTPEASLGSNHVDFGGINFCASAMSNSCSMVVWNNPNATPFPLASTLAFNPSSPWMPPRNEMLGSERMSPMPMMGVNRLSANKDTSNRFTTSSFTFSTTSFFGLKLYQPSPWMYIRKSFGSFVFSTSSTFSKSQSLATAFKNPSLSSPWVVPKLASTRL